MLKLSENQIEDIIYSSPWLLDERFILPNIEGSQGEKGRQINIGQKNSRFIDLLFKDTRDDRPVVIELKKGKLTRTDVGQLLEYRSMLMGLEENHKDMWSAEFGRNFYAPKLMLIGAYADEEIKVSANIAGIELRLFGEGLNNNLGFDSFNELEIKIKEWNSFRKSGNRTLFEREEWLEKILSYVQEVLENNDHGFHKIEKLPSLSSRRGQYIDYTFPFLNIMIQNDDENFIGLYEYYDKSTPFSDDYIYVDFPFMHHYDLDDDLSRKAFKMTREFIYSGVRVIESLDDIPILTLKRSILEDEKEFTAVLKKMIDLSVEIYELTYNV